MLYTQTLLQISDQELCKQLKLSRTTLYRYKNNLSFPNASQLENIYAFIYQNGIDLNRLKEELYLSHMNDNVKILFHGSKEGLIGEPCADIGLNNKDFGKGFYLGESVIQAISFVSAYDNSTLYIFELNNFKKIKKLEFDVSIDWMILVAYFRGKIDEYKDSKKIKTLLNKIKDIDLIIAPIADNTMYSIINEFIEGSITDLQCLNSLSANRLGKQYVFLNNKVIKNNLVMLSKNYLCKLEKENYANIKMRENDLGKKKVILAKREFAGKGHYIEELLND